MAIVDFFHKKSSKGINVVWPDAPKQETVYESEAGVKQDELVRGSSEDMPVINELPASAVIEERPASAQPRHIVDMAASTRDVTADRFRKMGETFNKNKGEPMNDVKIAQIIAGLAIVFAVVENLVLGYMAWHFVIKLAW